MRLEIVSDDSNIKEEGCMIVYEKTYLFKPLKFHFAQGDSLPRTCVFPQEITPEQSRGKKTLLSSVNMLCVPAQLLPSDVPSYVSHNSTYIYTCPQLTSIPQILESLSSISQGHSNFYSRLIGVTNFCLTNSS